MTKAATVDPKLVQLLKPKPVRCCCSGQDGGLHHERDLNP